MNFRKQADSLLRKIAPSLHGKLKGFYRGFKKQVNPKLSRGEFASILTSQLGVRKGDVLFVHSSMRSLYCDFEKSEILDLLMDVVGPNGTLAFPCWQFNIRAEDYILENEIVFDVRNSPSAMGKIPDSLRLRKEAYRSFHPTNSIVAIGKHAKYLTEGHETGIYPCGVQSPLYKLIELDAKIVGLGVTVSSLTFVHVVEDTIKDQFPLKTRSTEVYHCRCLDENGNERIIDTVVATPAIGHRDVEGFFARYVPVDIYKRIQFKNMDFFSLKAPGTYEAVKNLALENMTIYNFK